MSRFALTLLLVLVANASEANNDGCWQDGYKKGVCDARGQTTCLPPIPPIAPIPPIGRDDCQSRFADGYRAGIASGR